MGSFCTSKPVVTTKNESGSGTQSGTSSQTYTPAGLGQLNDIWSQVQNVASQPFNPYGGQMVAGLSPTQQSGIANINSAYGMAQPYLNTAANYATEGAAAINPADLARYTNPYTSSVIDATRRNFGETNAQQQQQVVGNAALQGASGGDRVRVAQAELARQQKLAQDPIIANLNAQNYSQALAAAQADRAAKAQGAFTYANLGPTAQNAALQGAFAQLQGGGLEQGTEQAGLSAAYNEYLRQQAFPYQQTQLLAQLGLPLATAMGGSQTGSTSGQTTSTGTGTQQQTGGGPSPLQMIAGGLGTAIGLGWNPMSMFGGGAPAMAPGLGTGGWNPNVPGGWDPTMGAIRRRDGGSVPGYAEGGLVDAVNRIRAGLRSRGDGIDARRDQGGTYVPGIAPHQGGGPYNTGGRGLDHFQVAPPMWGPNNPMTLHGYDDGGVVNRYPGGAFGGMPGWAPGEVPMGWNEGDYDALPNERIGNAFADVYPPALRDDVQPPAMPPVGIALPPQIANPDDQPIQMPQGALGYAGAPSIAPAGGLAAPPAMPQPQMAQAPAPSGPFGLSEDARMGLLSAGLGILASKGPHALTAIGEGGLAGVKTYGEQLKQRRSAEQEARKLVQQASQFAQNLDLSQQRLAETARHNQAGEAVQRLQLQRLDLQAMQPVKIGSDKYGAEIFAVRDPRSGGFRRIDPATGALGEPVAAPEQSAPTAPQAPALPPPAAPPGSRSEQDMPASPRTASAPVRLASSVLPDLNIPVDNTGALAAKPESLLPSEAAVNEGNAPRGLNPSVLAELPDMAETIKGVSEGRIQLPPRSFNTPYGKRLLEAVTRYDPSFDQNNMNARRNLRNSFLGGGMAARNIRAINQVMQHVGEHEEAVKKLAAYHGTGGWGLQAPEANAVRNQYYMRTGDREYQKLLADYEKSGQAIASELAKAFQGSGAVALESIRAWKKGLDPMASPVSQLASVQASIRLLQGGIDALGTEWNRGMGPASQREPLSWMSPKARDLYEQIYASDPVKTYEAILKEQEQKAREQKKGSPNTGASQGRTPSENHISALRSDPSPKRRQQFDQVYGPGAARRALEE